MRWFVVFVMLFHGQPVHQVLMEQRPGVSTGIAQGPFATREACESFREATYPVPVKIADMRGVDEIRTACAQTGDM